ncbi:MAG: C-GCAxxG-C-C family protein [Bacillota bacterium]|nr:C-GCAxxG-C-C family protein [Bacillota bacterium]
MNENMTKTCKLEKVNKLFSEGFSCSQSIMAAYARDFNLDEETALRISSSFGGGIAGRKELCGAVSAALMVLGMKYGRVEAKDVDSKNRNNLLANKFIDGFKELYGTYTCGELLNTFQEENKGTNKDTRQNCGGLLNNTVDILEKLLNNQEVI